MQHALIECLMIVLLPLMASLVSAFGRLNNQAVHRIAISAVALSFFLSLTLAKQMLWDKTLPAQFELTVYQWAKLGTLELQIGFLLDSLTLMMMLIVSFISWMVHVYTIGYMHDDPGYRRFFSYISLFTFAMLMLVMANNFLQLFFGWEAVGVVSYLLIGFWFKKDTAIFANLKAFLVNRVGDFGFLLGIGALLSVFGTLNYLAVFNQIPLLQNPTLEMLGYSWSMFSVIAILLFIGAMGKSAQMPLHVWLPDSMEGPTPISALIHAATMVTAGVFMIARMSPLIEHSITALTIMMIIGAATCLLMGLLGVVQNDIKRVIAYSTLSQLGYMVSALGASAYAASMFHLMTHAFFKALLFLGAGAVIIALHHQQDIRHMGGLRRYLPITYVTMLIGSLALVGMPFFSGFYSKDTIIEAVHLSTLPAAQWVYWVLLISVSVTALYSFRMFFLVFHTKSRMSEKERAHLHEVPWVMWLPLVVLALGALGSGAFITPLFAGWFNQAIQVLPEHDVMSQLAVNYHGLLNMAKHGFSALPFWFGVGGIALAWLYIHCPVLGRLTHKLGAPIFTVLKYRYGFDAFNQTILAKGTRLLGQLCWRLGDVLIIESLVNGSAKAIHLGAKLIRRLQSGYVYHYAFAMITGLIILMLWVF